MYGNPTATKEKRKCGWMLFFKFLFISIMLMSGAYASGITELITSKSYGACETNNLFFSAMKFYKIPLNEKYESYDKYLRLILFFNLDGTLSLRTSTQALLGCQTSNSGEVFCSYRPLTDSWLKTHFSEDGIISIKELGDITFQNPSDLNRGFALTFNQNAPYPHLNGQSFIGGMVSVNFDQNGNNTINICK